MRRPRSYYLVVATSAAALCAVLAPPLAADQSGLGGARLAVPQAVVPTPAQVSIRVAAAADLQAALPELIRRFESETKIQVVPVFGSSGTLTTQIQQGAPFDVLLSADVAYPLLLAERGFADRAAVVTYARGRLAIWTRNDTQVDLSAGLKGLAAPTIRRLAIANPEHAPYGRAAVAALKQADVYEAVHLRFVLGENIAQTAQFARTGNADVAIIALALAVGPGLKESGRYVVIPAALHPPLDQGAVWLKGSKQPDAARQFVAFLRQPATVAYLTTVGFEAPPEAPK